MEEFIINLTINQMNFVTKVLKPRTFLLVKMSICGGEACRPSLMVAIQRWWRVWAAGRGGGGDALTLLSNIVLLLCSAPGTWTFKLRAQHRQWSTGDPHALSRHLSTSNPLALPLMLGDKLPQPILKLDTFPPAILMFRDIIDNPEDNSYINTLSLPLIRIWFRYRARAIAKVKSNFKQSYND